jgi:hypothetical protein
MANGTTLAASLHTSTQFAFPLGPGAGANAEVVLSVRRAGRTQVSSLLLSSRTPVAAVAFSFQPPTVSAIRGCVDVPPGTTLCDPSGGQSILIEGSNFGVDVALIRVTVRSRLNRVYTCSGVTLSALHAGINCTLPAVSEAGFNLPVTVDVAGQSVTVSYLSFRVPIITPGTLVLNCNATARSVLNVTDCNGGQLVCFNGTNFGSNVTAVSVFYGTASSPELFACTVEPTQFVAGSRIGCRLAEGVGIDLQLVVQVGLAQSARSSDVISYPIPRMLNATIRGSVTGALGQTAYTPQGKSTQGMCDVFIGWIALDIVRALRFARSCVCVVMF